MKYIKSIEKNLNKVANKNYLPLQMGDIKRTLSNNKKVKKLINFRPNTPVQKGLIDSLIGTKNITMYNLNKKEIVIVGLGYVGLPLSIEFGRKFKTLGYDISKKRVSELKKNSILLIKFLKDKLNIQKIKYDLKHQ